MKNGIQSGTQYLKQDVKFCAFKKQKNKAGIVISSKNSAPPSFDSFEMLPSVGASGGLVTIWKGAVFSGQLVFQNNFALTVKFSSRHNCDHWYLTNVYGPCTHEEKMNFLHWFKHYTNLEEEPWLIMGDSNLFRKPKNRNKPGGDVNEMLIFNDALSSLGLIELPLYGRKFTWSNKQPAPLLERLDWFFTSSSWTTAYPEISVSTLIMQTSDHWPCNISISTSIPRSKIFRFENYWLQQASFLQTAQQGWDKINSQNDKAKTISAKFKNLRKVLRAWQHNLSNLKRVLGNVKNVLSLLELI